MLQMIEANWVAFALALVIGLLVAWWLFGRASGIERRERRPTPAVRALPAELAVGRHAER